MPSEVFVESQFHLPARDAGFRPASEMLGELLRPPGRFRIPLPFRERAVVQLSRAISGLAAPLVGEPLFFASYRNPVPLNWGLLLKYLHEEGVIAEPRVYFTPMWNDDPKMCAVSLPAPLNESETDGHEASHGLGYGESFDLEEAISKAVGEQLERLALLRYHKSDFLHASADTLRKRRERFLDPRLLTAAFPEQDARRSGFSAASELYWAKGEDLISGRSAWIPAQLVFWNYLHDEGTLEPFLREPNTNGAGGHFTREEALLAGIRELIERDAFLVHWLANIPPPRVRPETIPHPAMPRLLDALRRYDLHAVFLDTTFDMPLPSAACVVIDRTGHGPAAAMGGACNSDFAEACVSSAMEALCVRADSRRLKRSFVLPANYLPFSDHLIDREARLALWSGKEMLGRMKPFLSGKEESFADRAEHSPERASPAATLEAMLDFFRSRGEPVYAYEADQPFLKLVGYHAAKVIIPGLVPLYLRERNAPTASLRLKKIMSDAARHGNGALNPLPHPFP